MITLIDDQVFEVSLVEENLPYKTGNRAKNGKTFSRYRYDGKVFSVPTDSPFNEDFKSGNVCSVKLQEATTEGTDTDGNAIITHYLTFDSHKTNSQILALENHRANLEEVKSRGEIAKAKSLAFSKIDSTSMKELLGAIHVG